MTDRDRDVRERCAENRPDLAAIEARLNASTHGVWASQGYTRPEDGVGIISWPHGSVKKGPSNGLVCWAPMSGTEIDAENATRAEANAEFIAHAHQDIPTLIACIRALDLPLTSARTSFDLAAYVTVEPIGGNFGVYVNPSADHPYVWSFREKFQADQLVDAIRKALSRSAEPVLTSAREVTDVEIEVGARALCASTGSIIDGFKPCSIYSEEAREKWRDEAKRLSRACLQASLASAPQPTCVGVEIDFADLKDTPRRNPQWIPSLQDLVYEAINWSREDCPDADEDAGQQFVERLLIALRRALSPAPSPQAGGDVHEHGPGQASLALYSALSARREG